MSGVGYVVKAMVLTIAEEGGAATAYECAVTGVSEVPSADTQTIQTACPDGSMSDVGPTSWVLTIDYLVSNLPGSLHRLLRDNEGRTAVVTLEPFPITEPGTILEYDVTLTPAGAGYVVGQFGAASASVPVSGKPRTVDPVVEDAPLEDATV